MKTKMIRWAAVAIAACGASLGRCGVAEADIVVSVTIDDKGLGPGSSFFGTLDLTTGRFTEQFTPSQFVGALTTDAKGTLYAATADGHLNTVGPGGVFTQYGSGIAPVPNGGSQFGYYGLATTASGFLGVNVNDYIIGSYLDTISADGNKASTLVGPISSYSFGAAGALSYGPDGSLYMVASPTTAPPFGPPIGPELMRVDPTTGATTVIGSGLGTYFQHDLALVTVGNQLYGIDAVIDRIDPPHVGIYTINTTTGVATATGVDITGLPFGYRIDGVANALVANAVTVPEPSSIAMVLLGALAIGGAGRARRRRRAARSGQVTDGPRRPAGPSVN